MSTIKDKPRRHLYTFNDPDIKGSIEAGQPIKIVKGSTGTFRIYTGPKTAKGDYIVRIGLEILNGYQDARFSVKVNNSITTPISDLPTDSLYKFDPVASFQTVKNVSEVAARIMQFKADTQTVQNGYNNIAVSNLLDDEQKIIWMEVYVE